jgi:hypothetical protein
MRSKRRSSPSVGKSSVALACRLGLRDEEASYRLSLAEIESALNVRRDIVVAA